MCFSFFTHAVVRFCLPRGNSAHSGGVFALQHSSLQASNVFASSNWASESAGVLVRRRTVEICDYSSSHRFHFQRIVGLCWIHHLHAPVHVFVSNFSLPLLLFFICVPRCLGASLSLHVRDSFSGPLSLCTLFSLHHSHITRPVFLSPCLCVCFFLFV